MRQPAAIRADDLQKRFGPLPALDGVSFTVRPGTVFGLLGPNGAGKTTTVRILTTLVRADAGRAWVAGHDVVTEAARVRRSIGLAGQLAAVDEHLTGAENLEMVGRLHRLGRRQARRAAGDLLDRFGLSAAADRPARTYSGGMRRRLDLAASLVACPPVLLLDEPTAGLDPTSRFALWEEIRRLRSDGTTLLLTTQYLEEADRLADHIAVIDRGRLVAEGTPAQLKASAGGNRLHIRTADVADAQRAAQVLGGPEMSDGTLLHDGTFTVAASGGTATVAEAASRLYEAGIELAEFAMRGPSLDEAFLTLTGRGASIAGVGVRRQTEPSRWVPMRRSCRPTRPSIHRPTPGSQR